MDGGSSVKNPEKKMDEQSAQSRVNRPRYAARLNAFKAAIKGKATIGDLIGQAAVVPGLDSADLNYPDHFESDDPSVVSGILRDNGMMLNGLAMRYYTNPKFSIGAFTNPDPQVRQQAIDLTKKGIDVVAEMGGNLMTIWLGQDGFDYSFQMDYRRAWDDTVAAIEEVARHNPQIDVSIEYKPNEPRAYAVMSDVGSTLLAVKEAGCKNLGVTLDFAHVLYADEMPAHTASLVARHSRLLGVHLNDGYGKRDDGLMVGSVHPIQTVELLVALAAIGYDSVIYFDTFPDHGGLDPQAECQTNILATERLREIAEALVGDQELAKAIASQDAAISHRIVSNYLFGRAG
jgi:sugar phosphate isomerase/epimerase